ncbi:MAG: response regulator [Phycisphaerales bacterium]|nr:response regulator [Phycisphaerae bacterium]NNF42123.1 response regulator [Phycisphaerales bacterium]NNM24458.1 response regulator [Phycisphaerales bacterium]
MSTPSQTILLVDDEPHVVHVVRFKLEQAGFEVIVANNGKVAFELAQKRKPALVVTDFQMPGGSGLDLATQMSRNPETNQIPLIMLTARGHRAPLSDLARTNVRSLLAKPFSPRHLLAKVHELLAAIPTADRDATSKDTGSAAA